MSTITESLPNTDISCCLTDRDTIGVVLATLLFASAIPSILAGNERNNKTSATLARIYLIGGLRIRLVVVFDFQIVNGNC